MNDYLEEKFDEALCGDYNVTVMGESILTDIDMFDSDLLKSLNMKKCKEVVPSFTYDSLVYQAPAEDGMSGNDTMEEIQFTAGVDFEDLSVEQVDKLCAIIAEGYRQYLQQ